MKITLRDLFWLVLVAAVAAGWVAHYRSFRESMRRDVLLEQQLHRKNVAQLTEEFTKVWEKGNQLERQLADQAAKCSGEKPAN